MGRPEILFPLFAGIGGLKGVGPAAEKAFARLKVQTVRDLLFHLPSDVVDRRPLDSLAGVEPGQVATLSVEVMGHSAPRRPGTPHRVSVQGGGTFLDLIFFRAQPRWLGDALPMRARRLVSGKLERYGERWQMAHPDVIVDDAEGADLPDFEPVYPRTEGLFPRQIVKAAAAALAAMPPLPEWQDPALLKREDWPAWDAALSALHRPEDRSALSPAHPARRRLAYDELLSHQLTVALGRAAMRRGKGRETAEPHMADGGSPTALAAQAFGYAPTGAQARALAEIRADMARPERMMRLLQGDVGAGKTWVACLALMVAVAAGGQGALMAPTEILARQHGASLAPIAQACGVHLTVLTGRDSGQGLRDKLAAVADGRAQIVIGTHKLFSQDVAFADLRLAVIDEQHRFGVRQRLELMAKAPGGCDVLIMTATPIPRTLALAGYGDLDISVLDEKPPGRQPVDTRLISAERQEAVVARLAAAIAEGRRAYWVCPAVEDRPDNDMVAAEARAAALTEALGAGRVTLVHGQMPPERRDAAMADFQAGRAQVLVATTVIEVGVDIPEATIMVIEQADSFGLAQLHQLRGRVGRGGGESHCLLMYTPPLGETAAARLSTLRDSEDGFAIAEKDLALRGAGDLIGTAQSGVPRFALADLEVHTDLLAIAQDDARRVLALDPTLSSPRGEALRVLLYLMERDASIRLLASG
ncbi:MAG: ATP-dependent DNA helicase RecG [Pseudomonadota bacterium]